MFWFNSFPINNQRKKVRHYQENLECPYLNTSHNNIAETTDQPNFTTPPLNLIQEGEKKD